MDHKYYKGVFLCLVVGYGLSYFQQTLFLEKFYSVLVAIPAILILEAVKIITDPLHANVFYCVCIMAFIAVSAFCFNKIIYFLPKMLGLITVLAIYHFSLSYIYNLIPPMPVAN